MSTPSPRSRSLWVRMIARVATTRPRVLVGIVLGLVGVSAVAGVVNPQPPTPTAPLPIVVTATVVAPTPWAPPVPATQLSELPSSGVPTTDEQVEPSYGDDNGDGVIDEDESGWDCRVDGNATCGPGATVPDPVDGHRVFVKPGYYGPRA